MSKKSKDKKNKKKNERVEESVSSDGGAENGNASVEESSTPAVFASPRPPISQSNGPVVAIVMGSKSDWDIMRHADETLSKFDVPHECRVISAHRTPQLAHEFATTAESRGLQVIIGAAGGAAHLAGVLAANTTLPVLGVPMKSDSLNGLDSLLATVQMPAGIPVGTLAIGKAGAINASLFAIAILANNDTELREKLSDFRAQQDRQIRDTTLG